LKKTGRQDKFAKDYEKCAKILRHMHNKGRISKHEMAKVKEVFEIVFGDFHHHTMVKIEFYKNLTVLGCDFGNEAIC
jgi:hypothetical protein